MTTQPDNFGFGEDEAMLRDSARKFFTDNMTADQLHRLVAHDFNPERENACAWDQELWQQLVELGWTAACVPERAGGIGMPLVKPKSVDDVPVVTLTLWSDELDGASLRRDPVEQGARLLEKRLSGCRGAHGLQEFLDGMDRIDRISRWRDRSRR